MNGTAAVSRSIAGWRSACFFFPFHLFRLFLFFFTHCPPMALHKGLHVKGGVIERVSVINIRRVPSRATLLGCCLPPAPLSVRPRAQSGSCERHGWFSQTGSVCANNSSNPMPAHIHPHAGEVRDRPKGGWAGGRERGCGKGEGKQYQRNEMRVKL